MAKHCRIRVTSEASESLHCQHHKAAPQVPGPLNVVVDSHAMQGYQIMFRHLFELKCVERELNKTWRIYQNAGTRAAIRYEGCQGLWRRASSHGLEVG